MSFLDKAQKILNNQAYSGQHLIILFSGQKSLLFQSLLENFSIQLKKDKPNLNTYLLNIDHKYNPLKKFIENLLNSTDQKYNKDIDKIMIWPAFYLPGTFQKKKLINILNQYMHRTSIYLIKPLDFEDDIYPFILKKIEMIFNP